MTMQEMNKEIEAIEALLAAKKQERETKEKLESLKKQLELNDNEPSTEDKIFVKQTLSALQSGKIMYADTVKRYRGIYKNHMQWMDSNNYPDDVRGKTAQRFKGKY